MADIPESTKSATASDWVNSMPGVRLEHDPREGSEQAWLDFARAAPPAMDREVVVKPLDWRVIGQLSAYAEAATGATYAVQEFFGWDKRFQLVCREADDAKTRTTFWHTLAEAKAAAQSDHAARILSTLSAEAIRQGEGKVREWPDIGDDPMKSRPYEDRMAVSADAIRKAYTVQQPIVPDQTALVWRWHLGALLEAEIRLRSILADEPATPASHASDGGKA